MSYSHSDRPREVSATGWVGWIVFAGSMMVLVGFYQVIVGLVAIFNDGYFLVPGRDLIISIDYTAWGWIHLGLGVLAVAAGFGAILGQTWARVAGIFIAGISALANMAFIGAYPLWSILIITVDILAIYALAVHGREMRGLM